MATVTVACNLPHGLVLRTFAPSKINVPMLGGGLREMEEHHEAGRITINGNAIPALRDPMKEYPALTPNGYALTHGVDAELWASWLNANKNSPVVVNKCIFAVEKDAVGEARRAGEAKSGLEPLTPDRDPRMPRGNANVRGVTAGSRAA